MDYANVRRAIDAAVTEIGYTKTAAALVTAPAYARRYCVASARRAVGAAFAAKLARVLL